ncbi:MAG: T9SS type A sorting domain-containing protein [Sporocytophaga sp.]|nr:T9SS type A sorting domain-containing protein [Sporocytophaga sp.]
MNTARKSTSIFIPEPDDWRSFDIPLEAAAGQKRVRVYITSYGKAGTTIYLDNIKVYKASPNLIINPYPNPATDAISVDVIMEGESNVQFDLYNTLGQKILSGSKFEKTSFTHQLATNTLQSGIYILTVSTSNQMVSKKIMITR